MKRLFALFFVVAALFGVSAVVAPAATAAPIHVGGTADLDPAAPLPLCARVNITVRSTTVGTGPEFVCIG